MKSPPKKKNPASGELTGLQPKAVTNFQLSENIHLIHRIAPEERYGLEIFVGADGRIRLHQTIDGHTRTIVLVPDEAELLADRLPRAISSAEAAL